MFCEATATQVVMYFTCNSDTLGLYGNYVVRGAKQGGGVGGVSTPPEFWMGGLNTCQPPLILRNFF